MVEVLMAVGGVAAQTHTAVSGVQPAATLEHRRQDCVKRHVFLPKAPVITSQRYCGSQGEHVGKGILVRRASGEGSCSEHSKLKAPQAWLAPPWCRNIPLLLRDCAERGTVCCL